MSTRDVFNARAELEAIERSWKQATGVYQTRREQAKLRPARAEEAQRKLQEESDRLRYTLEAGFGITLGQQYLTAPRGPPAGGRVTFIQQTTPEQLRARLRDIRARLSEVPD